jgi:hypothetical protein
MAVMAFLSGSIIASDTTDMKITDTAYGALEVGQVGNGYFYSKGGLLPEPISHVWQQRAYGYMGFNAVLKKHLQLEFTGGGLISFSTPQSGNNPQTMQPREFFYINSSFASYKFGEFENPFLSIQAGYFPYKYNQDAKNLGEYLFRTNSYPLVVYSDFDYAQANLLGVRINYSLPNKLIENDLMINSALVGIPVQDWSISDIIHSNIGDFLNLGLGIDFSNFLNVYQGQYPAQQWMERYFNMESLPVDQQRYFYLINGNDTVLYDWKSIKTEAQISIDPKKFIPLSIFGKNDLKLYGEMDIIGLKNYPKYYDKLQDRMLTMVGFNFPGFKVIDVVNIELEYCPNNSGFSDGNFFGSGSLGAGSIAPLDSNYGQGYYKLNRDPLRWSVYLKKSILDGRVDFIGQVARDHKKINFYYFDQTYMSFIESLPTTQNWWWVFKMAFNF